MSDPISDAHAYRAQVKLIAAAVLAMKTNTMDGEAVANVMLAYRHLEDAGMRLGKCIQALDNGVSVYDKRAQP